MPLVSSKKLTWRSGIPLILTTALSNQLLSQHVDPGNRAARRRENHRVVIDPDRR